MALVRATQQTALPTVRQLIGELKKLTREAASAPALDNLVANLEALDAHSGRKSLDVELILAGPVDAEAAGKLATWIGPGFHPAKLQVAPGDQPIVDVPGPPLDLRVQVHHLQSRLAQKAGAARAPIAVVILTRPLAMTEDERGALERIFDDRPQVVLLASTKKAPPLVPAAASAVPGAAADPAAASTDPGAPPTEGAAPAAPPAEGAAAEAGAPAGPPTPADEPWFKEIETKAKASAWSCLTHKYLPDTTLQSRVGGAPWDQLHDLFRAHGAVVGLESLSNVYDMVMEQVQGEMRVNKSVSQQKLAKFGGAKGTAAPPSPTVDLLADLKNRTQRLAAEFERGAADRLQDLLGQPAGLLVRETEQALGGLQELQLEKKSKTMGARVPASFEEKINKLIRERVGRHCAGDLVALNDLFRLIGQEFERTLAQAQGPPIVVQFRYLTDERVRRMLDMFGIFQSPYKGEMPNPGFGEYFASVRKYSMVLVMGASMFGMSAMLRQYREITVPITVLLVAFGTYSVAMNTRQQRVENLETQLEAARVAMRTEIRRIITDLQKQWAAMLKEFLNDQISGAVAEVDAALKESQGKKGGDANPERDRLTRQLQAIEAAEKRIAASGKTREAFVASVTQLRGDLKGLMAGGGPPGMARPGMPGAPGMPPRPGMPAIPPRPGMPGAAGVARPGMPAMPPRPGVPGAGAPAGAPNSAMADARAKMEAMKAARAAGAAAPATGAAPAAPGAPAGGGAAADFRARMAAMKAKPAEGAPAAPAGAEPAAAPAAPAAAAPAAPAAPAEPKMSAADAFKAKMAAMKAAKAADAPAAAAAGPAAAAAGAPPATGATASAGEAPAAPAASPAAPAAAPAAPAPAPPAAAEAPAAPAAPAEPKMSAADAFKAKMAAMKAAKAGASAPAAAVPAAPAADAPPAAAAEPEAPAAPAPAVAAAAPAAPAEPKLSAAEAFKAKMAAMKAAKAPGAAPAVAPAAPAPAAAPPAPPAPAADAAPAAPSPASAEPAAAEPPAAEPSPDAEPVPATTAVPAPGSAHLAETMEIPTLPEVKGTERAE
jgi:hypothetical protein